MDVWLLYDMLQAVGLSGKIRRKIQREQRIAATEAEMTLVGLLFAREDLKHACEEIARKSLGFSLDTQISASPDTRQVLLRHGEKVGTAGNHVVLCGFAVPIADIIEVMR